MTAEPNDVEVSDLIIETGPLRDGLATAVGLLQREWTLEELDEPAEQTAAAALVARQVPGLDRVLGRARDTLNRKGAAILRGVPAESDVMLVAITSILGPVEAIRPGLPLVDDLWPAADSASATRNADNRRALTPHTDSSVLASAPEFVLVLGCVDNTDPAGGGESTLVFVDEIARELAKRGDGDVIALLQDHVFPNLNVPMAIGQPPVTTAVLGRRADGALVAWFRHEALRAGLESPLAQVMPSTVHRQALTVFSDAVLSPRRQRRARLTGGDVLMVDNGRVMHGRTAISPGVRRHLKRTFARRTFARQP